MSYLDPRLWLVVLALLAGAFGAGFVKGSAHGAQGVRNEWNEAKLAANREARSLEERRLSRVAESVAMADAREARIRGDALNARRVADGLRGDLDAARVFASRSADAANLAVATLGNVFESCVREYQRVAQDADGHASDALTLEQAWPRE